MAESPNRTPRPRRTRVSSRASTTRSSIFSDNPPSYNQPGTGYHNFVQGQASTSGYPTNTTSPYSSIGYGYSPANGSNDAASAGGGGGGNHGLRPMESRFSLNEHFAATRRDYEFGYDDASIFDRASVISRPDPPSVFTAETKPVDDFDAQLPDEEEWQEADTPKDANYRFSDEEPDYYEVLCVPREGLTEETVREAYWRWFTLLYPGYHGSDEDGVARRYFLRTQEAFETLVDPRRRAEYDLSLLREGKASVLGYADVSGHGEVYSGALGGEPGFSDVGVRFDMSGLFWPGRARRRVTPLDFTLGNSFAVGLPCLGSLGRRKMPFFRRLVPSTSNSLEGDLPAKKSDESDRFDETTFILPPPTLTVSGAVYGVARDMSSMPMTLLSDSYQPLLPLAIPRQSLPYLAATKLSPLVSLSLRQEVIVMEEASRRIRNITAIEIEPNILPFPTLTTRASHSRPLHGQPTSVEASITTAGRFSTSRPPQVCLSTTRVVSQGGAVFARFDGGDWTLRDDETCRFFTNFTRLNGKFLLAEFPLRAPPSFEVGYQSTCTLAPPPRNRDVVSRHTPVSVSGETSPSWSVSLKAMATSSLSAHLRRTIPFSFPRSESRKAIIELDLHVATIPANTHIAVRNLFPLGAHSRLGVELGVSAHSVHVSLSFSCLGRRVTLPFFVAPRLLVSPRTLLCIGSIPLLAAAGLHFFSPKKKSQKTKQERKTGTGGSKRREADELTFLLHRTLTEQNRSQTPTSTTDQDAKETHKLTILSAKYGAETSGWAGEDVADVTIALAALVRDDRVVLPRGHRIGRLPGFWDPAPKKEKVLRVRFTVGGDERVAEAKDGEGLVVP